MKTSNKLLIGLAILLFVLPVGGMVIWSSTNRLDSKEYENGVKAEARDAKAKDRFLISKKVDAFKKVIINGDGKDYINIYLVKSNDYALKFNKNSAENYTYTISEDGNLVLKPTTIDKYYTSIYLFAPNLTELDISQLKIGEIETAFEDLAISGNELKNDIKFGLNEQLKHLKFNLKNSIVNISTVNSDSKVALKNMQSIDLNLVNGGFSMPEFDLQKLTLNLNASSLHLIKDGSKKEGVKRTIKVFDVLTTGESTISIDTDSNIEAISGSVSDSTVLNLPVYLTKRLIK